MSIRQCRRRFGYTAFLLVMLAGGLSARLDAQEASSLPSGWEQLGPAEFVQALPAVYEPDEDVYRGVDDESVVRQHAASMFSAVDVSTTQLGYRTLYWLYALAYPKLDETTHDQVRQSALLRVDAWEGRPYEDVRGKFYLLERAGASWEEQLDTMRAWRDAGGAVSEMSAEDLTNMRHTLSAAVERNDDFTLTWTGSVVAPADGAYTFYISPINISARAYSLHDRYDLMQTISVTLGGQTIIDATPGDWGYQSLPIPLAAGQAVPLRMEMTVDCDDIPRRAVHAQLLWSGPGVPAAIIPASQLSLPAGGEAGLQRTLSWEQGGQPQRFTQTVSGVDNAWADGFVLFEDLEIQQQVNERQWQELMNPAYLDTVTGGVRRHPFLDESEGTVDCLTTAQCREFMATVLQRPTMLDNLQVKEMVDVYRSFRLKAPDQALSAFGQWAQRHSSAVSRMPHEYQSAMRYFQEFLGCDFYNRKAYRLLAIAVGKELPAHAERLQNEFLILEDGSCNLPVAYTLAYCQLGQDRFDGWVSLLDSQLDSDSLTGERRINWLLARAYAEEMRLFSTDIYADGVVRPLDGLRWIEEAQSNAELPATKVRLAKELAARLSSIRKFADARTMLDNAGQSVNAELQAEIASYQDCVNRFEAWNAESCIARSKWAT